MYIVGYSQLNSKQKSKVPLRHYLKLCSCAQFAPGCKFAPPYVAFICQLIVFIAIRCLNVLNDSNSVSSRCTCVGGRWGGFLDIWTTECVVEPFTLHSYKGQVTMSPRYCYAHEVTTLPLHFEATAMSLRN